MKKRIYAALIFSLLLNAASLKGQTVKGFYVNGFDSILGNSQKEDSLLTLAHSCQYNYMILYDLWTVHTSHDLTNLTSSAVLADFILKAKQNFGILQVGASGENFFFFNNVIQIYNQQHSNPLQKFDVYNVEFEFWNTATVNPGGYYCTTYLNPGGYSCDTTGAFSYYHTLIHQVDSIGNLIGVISETYIGWFNQGQAIAIGNTVDRILLHDYISNYSQIYSYIQPRLQYIASRNILTDVIPIFSAEAAFMAPWLSSHTVMQPFTDVQTNLAAETGAWKAYIHLDGYQWFTYSFLPLPPDAVAGSDTLICTGSTINLSASGGTSYSWIPTTGLTDALIANPAASPGSTTNYIVTVSLNGCQSSDSTKITVDVCGGIDATETNDQFLLFPNPFLTGTDVLHFYNPDLISGDFGIFNFSGSLILKQKIAGYENSIHTEGVSPGIYFWRMLNEQGIPTRQGKIIIE